jgi:MinD-like ATPase involved in chromosome partitioning or flagellar assembly
MRNVAARTSISLADFLLVILGGSQNLLARYLSQTSELDELQKNRLLVLNRAASNPARARALKELTGESILATIPNDEPSFQLAESQQLPLAIARRKSAARTSIAELAHKLLAWQPSVK